jgi:hypothetical protein
MSLPLSRSLRVAVALIVLSLCVVAVIGCSGSEGSSTTTTEAAPAPAPTSTEAPSSTTTAASVETTASSGGPATDTGEIGAIVSVSSTNGGYPTENVPDWSQIKSVMAFFDPEYGDSAIWVCLATDQVTASSLSEYWDLPNPAVGQGRIELGFTRTLLDTNEPPMVAGTYDFITPQGKAELTGWASIIVTGGTSVTFSGDSDMESDVQITSVSDTEISGTFHVKDKWSEISGSFTSPIN